MKDRSKTRHHLERVKNKVRKVMKATHYKPDLSSKRVGKEAACHMRSCSCWMCQRTQRRPEIREDI